MKAFLLAAGFGERLRPITDALPKPLAPVLNLPAICYAVTLLKEAGISDIICNLHYRGEQIVEFFKRNDCFDMRVEFSDEERILGTGGGLMKCRAYFQDAPFVYLNSDIIADIDLSDLIKSFDGADTGGSLALAPSSRGSVALKGERIVNIRNLLPVEQKPGYDFLGAGILTPDIFKFLRPEFSDIVETGFIELVKQGELRYFSFKGEWHDIGSVESYRETNIRLIDSDYVFRKRIYSATGLVPCVLGDGAQIGTRATVSRSVIGEGSVIEDGAVVEESVLLPNSKVMSGDKVIRKVVGPDLEKNARTAV